MRSTSRLRGVALTILCITAAGCSKNSEDRRKVDPNLPAVVNLGPPILPSDTAKKPVPVPGWAIYDSLQFVAINNYAFMGAFLARGDARQLVTMYHPDADLVMPNAQKHGREAIAKALIEQAKSQSLTEFNRRSRIIHASWKDSTVTDSGVYEIHASRDGKTRTVESGKYITTWHVHAPPTEWTILKDEFKPSVTGKP